MRKNLASTLLLTLVLVGCQGSKDEDVIAQNYVHKYGYAISKNEWESTDCPTQVITTRRDGVTITETYETGHLNGPTTHTFPFSQIVQHYYLYNQGVLVKELLYDSTGMPLQEKVHLSPSRNAITLWYAEGSPRSIEEFSSDKLIEGQYFTVLNERDGRVIKENGTRVERDIHGELIAKEQIINGYVTEKETYFSNGYPESICTYKNNALHGTKKSFSPEGQPLAIEHYVDGKIDGVATFFKNGTKYLEVPYVEGIKHGKELHFIDGESICQETTWIEGIKHGPAYFYVDGTPTHVEWYYLDEAVSKKRFDDLSRFDEIPDEITFEPKVSASEKIAH